MQNEKRQGENRPYAKAEDLIIRATMPLGHPYDHSVIGSMEDLDAASLEDVKEWFRTYYGPTNAVLVLAGDITPAEAKAKVEKYFGDIAPGTPVAHPQSWVVKRTGTQRETAYDRVAQPRLYARVEHQRVHLRDTDYLQFLGLVLAGDKNARLYKRLVMDEQLATSGQRRCRQPRDRRATSASTSPRRSEKDLPAIEKIVEEELRKLIDDRPDAGRDGAAAHRERSRPIRPRRSSSLAASAARPPARREPDLLRQPGRLEARLRALQGRDAREPAAVAEEMADGRRLRADGAALRRALRPARKARIARRRRCPRAPCRRLSRRSSAPRSPTA